MVWLYMSIQHSPALFNKAQKKYGQPPAVVYSGHGLEYREASLRIGSQWLRTTVLLNIFVVQNVQDM